MKAFYCLFFFFFLLGCNKKEYEKNAIFSQIEDKAIAATGNKIYWNRSDDLIKEVAAEELLKKTLTEKEAVMIAMLNNPRLQAEYERIGIASANYKQAGLLKNPFFLFNYEFTTSSTQTEQINIELTQSILQMLMIPLKRRAAKREIEIVKNEILNKVIETTAQTKIAFHNLQVNFEILQLKKKICYSKELAYEGAIKLRLAGNITELKLTKKRRLAEAEKLNVKEAEIIYLNGKESLNNLLGLWGEDINWDFEKTIPTLPEENRTNEEIENIAVTNNLSLKATFDHMKKRASDLKVETAEIVFEEVALGIATNYQTGVWFPGPQIELSVPIFDIGVVHSHKAKAEISYLWKSFISEAVKIRTIARKAHLNYLNAYNQAFIVKNSLIPISEKILEETMLQHNAMQLGIFAVLAAKESELSQKVLFLEKEKEFYKEKIAIEALTEGTILLEASL